MFSRQDSIRIMKLWADYESLLTEVLERMIKQLADDFSPFGDEWEYARRAVEYQAKKQALIELKKILSKRYE